MWQRENTQLYLCFSKESLVRMSSICAEPHQEVGTVKCVVLEIISMMPVTSSNQIILSFSTSSFMWTNKYYLVSFICLYFWWFFFISWSHSWHRQVSIFFRANHLNYSLCIKLSSFLTTRSSSSLVSSVWATQEARAQLQPDINEHVVNIFERWKAPHIWLTC